MIIFALLERRQRRPVDGKELAAQRLGGIAVADLGEAGDWLAPAADRFQRKQTIADLNVLVPFEAIEPLREQLEANLAAYAVRAGDGGERDPIDLAYSGFLATPTKAGRSRRSLIM